jgi:hypothetical protein
MKPPKAEPPKAEAEFEGLDAEFCAERCNNDHCVVSGGAYCGHPRKGGIQSRELNSPVAVQRFNRAKAHIKQQEGDAAARRVLGGGYYGR